MDRIRGRIGPRLAGLAGALALLALVALGGPSRPASAVQEDRIGTPTPVPATVFVNGQGRVRIPPDTASVVVGVDVIRPTLDAAQTEATAQATAIIDAVKAAGVAEEDIQTANYSVNIIRDYDEEGNPAEIRGFQVTNQVNVTIRDLDAIGDILDDVVAAGANNIYGISFYVEDPAAAASQARVQAVKDARTKADELAAAAGMKVGRLVSISESFAPPPAPEVFGGAADAVAESRVAVPVQIGTSEVIIDVQVTYELVPVGGAQ